MFFGGAHSEPRKRKGDPTELALGTGSGGGTRQEVTMETWSGGREEGKRGFDRERIEEENAHGLGKKKMTKVRWVFFKKLTEKL